MYLYVLVMTEMLTVVLVFIHVQAHFRLFRSEPDHTFQSKLFEKGKIQLVRLSRAIQAFLDHAEIRRGYEHDVMIGEAQEDGQLGT